MTKRATDPASELTKEVSAGEKYLKREWSSMLRRLVKHIENKSADLSERTMEIAAHVYTDKVRFDAEREVFRNTPLIAGLSVEIPAPGDRLLFDEAGPPVVIVRTLDNTLKAYLNICPHRGSRLVNTVENAQNFVCPYHAWRFDLDGNLLRRPRADAFEHDCEPEKKLIPVPVSEKHGMIFVVANPEAQDLDIDEFLGEMSPLVEAMELEKAELIKLDLIDDLDTNWKLAFDTFCEPYHVPVVHSNSLGDQVVPFVSIQDKFGIHNRYIGPGRDIEAFAGKDESEWNDTNYSGVHCIYPNTTFTYTDSIDGDTPVFTLFRLFPGADVGKCNVLYSTFKPKAHKVKADSQIFEKLHDDLHWVVSNEDFVAAANSYRSLMHAPKDMKLTFGKNEMVLQEYHRTLADDCNMPLDMNKS